MTRMLSRVLKPCETNLHVAQSRNCDAEIPILTGESDLTRLKGEQIR